MVGLHNDIPTSGVRHTHVLNHAGRSNKMFGGNLTVQAKCVSE